MTIPGSPLSSAGALSDASPVRATFTDYAQAGFGADLLPILPPDAEIHPESPAAADLLKSKGQGARQKTSRRLDGDGEMDASPCHPG